MTQIVVINASVQNAPLPITLQEKGALISQGATNLASGSSALLTQKSDLTPLLAAPLALTSLVWSGGTVLATTQAAIAGLATGDTFITTVANAAPAGFNGLVKATVTGANTFTYPLAVSPGNETTPGTYTPGNQGELQSMVNTFFGQGSGQTVSVLELGPGDGTAGPNALGTFIGINPNIYYSYLVPRLWDATAAYLALVAQFAAPNAKTYFFTTTTTATYTAYPAGNKCLLLLIEAPSLALTEFTLATAFQITLNYAPSSSNRQTPLAFSFVNGVTAFPQMGNNALLATLKAAFVNVISTAAEGGLSNNMITYGKLYDGNDFMFWFATDWLQLNTDQALSNAVINGSNDPDNPLYYDQPGVNTLQDVVFQQLSNGVSFGLLTGTVSRATLDGPTFQTELDDDTFEDSNVVNAVPFITYTTENPQNFAQGIYGGLSVVAIPNRGFTQIIVNLSVTDLINQ